MSITFRYEHVPRSDGTLRRAPYISVFAHSKSGKPIKILALVDSGADQTVLPKQLSLLLGLRESGADMETGGIGGAAKARAARFSFEIRGNHESHKLTVPALILQDPDADIPPILGRNGFFEHFHLTFKQSDEKITLKKMQPRHIY